MLSPEKWARTAIAWGHAMLFETMYGLMLTDSKIVREMLLQYTGSSLSCIPPEADCWMTVKVFVDGTACYVDIDCCSVSRPHLARHGEMDIIHEKSVLQICGCMLYLKQPEVQIRRS